MTAWRDRKAFADVLGRRMAYVEAGDGDPIVLLHGNPTSSYLWRDVLPELEGLGRCIAPDLIGMGDSDKLDPADPGRYTFASHRAHLDAFLEAVGVTENVAFVVHDWGGALGFDWAFRHPSAVRALVYMETIVRPFAGWEEWPADAREIFQGFRSQAGEDLVLERNLFVEAVLPSAIVRDLDPEDHDEYRRPFLQAGEGRLPTLRWPRQIPMAGEPADVVAVCDAYAAWLAGSHDLPKLFVNAEPGSILVGAQRELCRTWPNQQEVTVPGRHFVQEDSGPEIGRAAAAFLR